MTTKIELPLPITVIERKPLKRAQIALELPRVPTPLPLPEIVSKAPQIDSREVTFTEQEPESEVQTPVPSFLQNIASALQHAPVHQPQVVRSAQSLFAQEVPNVAPVQAPRPSIKSARELFDQSSLGDSVWTPTPVVAAQAVLPTVPVASQAAFSSFGTPTPVEGSAYVLTRVEYYESGETRNSTILRVFLPQELPPSNYVKAWFGAYINNKFNNEDMGNILSQDTGYYGVEFDLYADGGSNGELLVMRAGAEGGYFDGNNVFSYHVSEIPLGKEVSLKFGSFEE